jgi:hypothetical protein
MDNIKTNLLEVGWGVVDWIYLAQDRDKWRVLANVVLKLLVAQKAGKLLSGYSIGGVSCINN